jgi:hypothetical protein
MEICIMETQWLPCSVSRGQFPSEYAVAGTQFNGKGFSLFAPREVVQSVTPAGDGWMQVDVVDRKGDLALIRLPAQTFENGQYITVQAGLLQTTPEPAKVGA